MRTLLRGAKIVPAHFPGISAKSADTARRFGQRNYSSGRSARWLELRTARTTSPDRRRVPREFLERSAEGRLRFVANRISDFDDLPPIVQHPGGELHAPQRQIVHRGMTDHLGESRCQH
jgi:hypothetical protein